jgi:hypothetical protein
VRQASLRFVDAQHIRTIGKSANHITDLIRTASRRQLLFAAGAALIGTAACFVWYWVTIGRYIESTDDAYVGGEVTTLSFKVAGLIETVAIVDNQSVKAGDLLLKLDDRDYRAQLARTEANIAAPRSCSVCPCALCSTAMAPNWVSCGRDCRSSSMSMSARRLAIA